MEEKGGETSERALQRAQLREETLVTIQALTEQGIYDDKDLYYLVKNFFRRYLELSYEFTIEELRTELKKIYLGETTRKHLTDIKTFQIT